MRSTLLALIGLSLLLATVGNSQGLEGSDLSALQTAVHEICVQPDKKGSYLKVDGDLEAGGILRVAGVSAGGKITKEEWDGIDQRLDQYKTDPRQCAIEIVGMLAPLMKPAPKACRDPSHGVERYAREFDVVRDSPEMGGGHSQPEWCTNVIAALRGEHPSGSFSVVRSGEHTNNHCPPFNCPQYVYSCTVHVKTDPIYIEKISAACR